MYTNLSMLSVLHRLLFESQNTTYDACCMGESDLVSNWPFEGYLERCRGFDSLHAVLAVLVLILWYIHWGSKCIIHDDPIDLEHSVQKQVKSEDA